MSEVQACSGLRTLHVELWKNDIGAAGGSHLGTLHHCPALTAYVRVGRMGARGGGFASYLCCCTTTIVVFAVLLPRPLTFNPHLTRRPHPHPASGWSCRDVGWVTKEPFASPSFGFDLYLPPSIHPPLFSCPITNIGVSHSASKGCRPSFANPGGGGGSRTLLCGPAALTRQAASGITGKGFETHSPIVWHILESHHNLNRHPASQKMAGTGWTQLCHRNGLGAQVHVSVLSGLGLG